MSDAVMKGSQKLWNPIWEKTWPEIKNNLAMGLETTSIANPITMLTGKVPGWMARLFKPNEEQLLNSAFHNNPDKILQGIMSDRIGNVLARTAPSTHFTQGATVNEVVDAFDQFRHMVPGYPNATAKYLGYINQIPPSFAENIQTDILRTIPRAGMPVAREASTTIPTATTISSGVLGAAMPNTPIENKKPAMAMTLAEFIKQLGGGM